MQGTNDAFSRVKIDAQLKDQGWDVLNPIAVRSDLGSVQEAQQGQLSLLRRRIPSDLGSVQGTGTICPCSLRRRIPSDLGSVQVSRLI